MTIRQGDVGAKLQVITNNKYLAETDTFVLMIEKPSEATAEWALGIGDSIDYTTGEITYYTKTEDEVDEAGEYYVELKRTDNVGRVTKSDIGNFTVKESLF